MKALDHRRVWRIHSRRTSSTQLRFLGLSSMASMSSKRQNSSTKHVCQHSGEETEGRSHTTSQSIDEGPGVAEARDAGLVNCEYNCRACRRSSWLLSRQKVARIRAGGRGQRPRFREAESRPRQSNKPRCVSTASFHAGRESVVRSRSRLEECPRDGCTTSRRPTTRAVNTAHEWLLASQRASSLAMPH